MGLAGQGAAEGAAAGSMLGPYGAVAGAAIGLIGGIMGGEAQKSAADYQASVARYNAQIANQNAAQAVGAGETQAELAEMKGGQILGQAKSAQASRGVQVGVGSALDVQNAIKESTRQNSLIIKNNAARAAYGYQVQGVSDTSQEQMDLAEGQNALTSSLLGSAASATSDIWKLDQAGAFPDFGSGLTTSGIADPIADAAFPP